MDWKVGDSCFDLGTVLDVMSYFVNTATLFILSFTVNFFGCEFAQNSERVTAREVREHDAIVSSNTGPKWKSDSADPQNSRNISVRYFLNQSVGFASTNSGRINTVYKTNDGGINWNPVGNVQDTLIRQFQFVSELDGFAISSRIKPSSFSIENGSDILHTIDGGRSWTSIYFAEATIFHSLKFNSYGVGVAVGERATPNEYSPTYAITISDDAGKTWKDCSIREGEALDVSRNSNSDYLRDVLVGDDNCINVISRRGDFFESCNSCESWKMSSSIGPAGQRYGYSKIGEADGRKWALGGGSAHGVVSVLAFESDHVWDKYFLSGYFLSDVVILPNKEIIACGKRVLNEAPTDKSDRSVVLASTDNGVNWDVIFETKSVSDLVSIFVVSNDNLKVFDGMGSILTLTRQDR